MKLIFNLTVYFFALNFANGQLSNDTLTKQTDSINTYAWNYWYNKNYSQIIELRGHYSEFINNREIVDLNGIKYKRISDSLKLFTNLKYLTIYGHSKFNLIFPSCINNLTKLEYLSFSNEITDSTFPRDLFLPNLNKIGLGKINLNNFPIGLHNCHRLEVVSFDIGIENRKQFRLFIKGLSKLDSISHVNFTIVDTGDKDLSFDKLSKAWKKDIKWARRYLKRKNISFDEDYSDI